MDEGIHSAGSGPFIQAQLQGQVTCRRGGYRANGPVGWLGIIVNWAELWSRAYFGTEVRCNEPHRILNTSPAKQNMPTDQVVIHIDRKLLERVAGIHFLCPAPTEFSRKQ